jgi:VanZ family protein
MPETFLQKTARAAAILFLPALAGVLGGELSPMGDGGLLIWDKLLHFTAYFILSLLATTALRAGRNALLAVLGLIALGGALEIIQGFIGRDAELMDEAANTLGAIAGFVLGWTFITLVAARSRQL